MSDALLSGSVEIGVTGPSRNGVPQTAVKRCEGGRVRRGSGRVLQKGILDRHARCKLLFYFRIASASSGAGESSELSSESQSSETH